MPNLLRLVIAAVLLLAGCTSEGGSGNVRGAVGEALAEGPASATEMHVTEWSALARAASADLADLGERADMLQQMAETGTLPIADYGSYRYPDHAELWGWDIADVEWEAAFRTRDGAGVYLIRFGDTFDTADLTPLFEERGYERSEEGGADVFQHEVDLQAEWLANDLGPRAPLAVLNVAILDQRSILASEQPEALSGAAADRGITSEALVAVAERLGDLPVALAIEGGEASCARSAGGQLTAEIEAELDRLRGNVYSGLGIGYTSIDPDSPQAVVVLHYDEAATAEEDLDLRSEAAQGTSLRTGGPYSAETFTFQDAEVRDQDLVLRFGPSESGGLHLARAAASSDLAFAAC